MIRQVERMFRLGEMFGAADVGGVENVVFVTRPDVAAMEAVADTLRNIENAAQAQNRPELHALFVPDRSLLCDKRLQDLGVYGSFTCIDEVKAGGPGLGREAQVGSILLQIITGLLYNLVYSIILATN